MARIRNYANMWAGYLDPGRDQERHVDPSLLGCPVSPWAPAEVLARLVTPGPSGRRMIRQAKLEKRGPQPEKRDRRTDYVGCWKWVGDRHISVQVLALKWLRELRQSR